jgi:hypothetical protein
MPERAMLEREVHQLRQIIRADAFALGSRSTPSADRARLRTQIDIRTALQSGLLKRLGGISSPGTAEARGTNAQAKACSRGKAHQGHLAVDPVRPARPHQDDRAHAGSVQVEAWRSPAVRRAASSIWSLVMRNSSQRAPLWTRSSVDRG